MILELVCGGRDWQEDFTTCVERLTCYFSRCFRGWRDREEVAHEALLLFMERFRDHWRPGTTLRLTTNFSVRAVRRGLRFLRRGNGGRHCVKSVRTLSNRDEQMSRIKARIDRWLSRIDLRLILAGLPVRERIMVELALEGNATNTIARQMGADWRTVRKILQTALASLVE